MLFSTIFFTILRYVAIPIVAIIFLKGSFLGEQGAFMAVNITLTISVVVSIIINVFRFLGNTLILRGSKLISIILQSILEVASVIGFWLYYISRY